MFTFCPGKHCLCGKLSLTSYLLPLLPESLQVRDRVHRGKEVQGQLRLAPQAVFLVGCGEGIKTRVVFSGWKILLALRCRGFRTGCLCGSGCMEIHGMSGWAFGTHRMTRAHCRNEASLLPGNMTRAKSPSVKDQTRDTKILLHIPVLLTPTRQCLPQKQRDWRLRLWAGLHRYSHLGHM